LGLGNILFGRKKLKDAVGERLFAISTARITLEAELDLKPTGSAGVCFKALSAGEFVRAENEIQQLLESVATESGSKIERRSDELGFEWIVIRDEDFEDLVASVHLVASELEARGFGPQLLAAVFPFESRGFDAKHIYWIYGFKQGTFWPFVPKGEGKDKERDNAEELELKAKLEKELPVEPDLTRWFAIFDAPV
jgi:PspAB-like protein